MISNLKSNDPMVSRRGVRGNVGEIAIQRQQYSIQLLGLLDDNEVVRVWRNVLFQNKDFMSCVLKFAHD